jgi:cytochrome c
MDYLVKKIIGGGSGVWGEHGMSAHPDLSEINAQRMVDFIFSLKGSVANVSTKPLSGKVSPTTPTYEEEGGSFVLRAAYKDKGGVKTNPILSERMVLLRSNYLNAEEVDSHSGAQIITTPRYSFMLLGDKPYASFGQLDLSGVSKVIAYLQVSDRAGAIGGKVELHLDSPNGEIIGVSGDIEKREFGFARPPAGVSRAEFSRSRSSQAVFSLSKEIKGKHDVYLVFRNPAAKETDVLMQLTQVGFFK